MLFSHFNTAVRHCAVPRLRPTITAAGLQSRMYSVNTTELVHTQQQFNTVLESSKTPVLVDFFATWCGPCRLLTPILESIALANKDKLKIIKVDTDQLQQVAAVHKVQALPTLCLFQNGHEAGRLLGVKNQVQIQAFLDQHTPE